VPGGGVILHPGNAVVFLRAPPVSAGGGSAPGGRPGVTPLLILTFITVLFGALTANLGAAAACTGFPLCNGQVWPASGSGGLAHVHWVHRVLAYSLAGLVIVRAVRTPRAGPRATAVLVLVLVQVVIGAATVLLGLPPALQAAHLAVGTAVWGAVVLSA